MYRFFDKIKKRWYISSSNSVIGNIFYSSASTSGTSECKGFTSNEEQRIKYIIANYYGIQEDLAKGGGLYLDGLTSIMGCEGTDFQNVLKKDFEYILSATDSNGKKFYVAIKNKIKGSELKNICLNYS